ncbi:unnamed protein product [Mucor circinelloides]
MSVMASSAKETNGTFKGPISYKLSKKSWTEVITGGSLRNSSVMSEAPTTPQPTGEPDHLTSSSASLFLDHFTGKVTRSYLTGTVPHSIIIDITNVLDKKKTFIVDLTTFCKGNTHLWAVSEQIRKENSRLFAEILVSPSILPPQYGRQNGDVQLRNDMRFNLDQFGKLIDCGYVTGGKRTALTHAFNWTYNPVDYSSPFGNLLQIQQQVLVVFAMWAAMPPYCKYCHSMDHALIDCALRKKKLTYDLCHEFGHFQRECPRRNEDSSKSGKKRKVSQGSKKNAVSHPSSTSSEPAPLPSQSQIDKAASKANAAATVRATAEIQTVIDVNAAAEDPASNAIKAHVAIDARAATVARATTDDQATVDADKAPVPAHHHNTRSRSGPTPSIPPSFATVIPLHSEDDTLMNPHESSVARSTDPTFDATAADESDPDSMQD